MIFKEIVYHAIDISMARVLLFGLVGSCPIRGGRRERVGCIREIDIISKLETIEDRWNAVQKLPELEVYKILKKHRVCEHQPQAAFSLAHLDYYVQGA